jgi:succinoglycan biosynthesis protein ExoL
MTVTFLLPVSSHARYRKRFDALSRLGVRPIVFAFERDYYQGQPWPQGYLSLGVVKHRRYVSRLAVLPKAVLKVRSGGRDTDAFYAFSLDTLLIALIAGWKRGPRPKYIFEVGDIRDVLLGNGPRGRLLRCLERMLLRRTDLLVVTSEAFATEYFIKIQGLDGINYQVIENKLSASELALAGREVACSGAGDHRLMIGYFGLIRCRRSWDVLREVVKRGGGRIRLFVRGKFLDMPDVEAEARQSENIIYGGPFVSPDDLPGMYREIDISWIAHHHGESNLRWARANRFYEACFFGRPMIAQLGTQDGVIVAGRRIGKNVDLSDPERAIEDVLHIEHADIREWHENVCRLPDDIYLYKNEHVKLIENLKIGGKTQSGAHS